MISWLQKLISYFTPVILYSGKGVRHEHIEVSVRNGRLQLAVPDAIYSNDINYPPFVAAWEELHDFPVDQWEVVLILGFGLGSVPAILHKKHDRRDIHMVGVDYEKTATDIARNYKQEIYRGPWELVDMEVSAYLKEALIRKSASRVITKPAALVFVDLFVGMEVHPIIYDPVFWQSLLQIMIPNAKVAVNYMSSDSERQASFEALLADMFAEVKKIPCGKNWCYILGARKDGDTKS